MGVGRSAAYRRKERNSRKRKRKPIVFLCAEGRNKTETLYFKAFGQDVNRIVRFSPGNYTDPVNMVQCLSKYMAENDFSPDLGDKAFCLIDADISVSKDAQIAKAIKLAQKENIQVIVSAPCFEYWYLCHFGMFGKKYLSNSELLSDIQHYVPQYQKNAPDMYEILKGRLLDAIQNAQAMEKRHLKDGETLHTVSFYPSTEVYYVVQELNKNNS